MSTTLNISPALADRFTDNTKLVNFARTHAFESVLKAFEDPEYAIVGMDALAGCIALYLRHAGNTSTALPLSCGDLMVIDKEAGFLMLAVNFIWAHSETALNSLGYCETTADFIPLLRDNDQAPILRITGMHIDEDQFSEWAFGSDRSPDMFEFILHFEPSTIDPEWLAGRSEKAGDASEPSDADDGVDIMAMIQPG